MRRVSTASEVWHPSPTPPSTLRQFLPAAVGHEGDEDKRRPSSETTVQIRSAVMMEYMLVPSADDFWRWLFPRMPLVPYGLYLLKTAPPQVRQARNPSRTVFSHGCGCCKAAVSLLKPLEYSFRQRLQLFITCLALHKSADFLPILLCLLCTF